MEFVIMLVLGIAAFGFYIKSEELKTENKRLQHKLNEEYRKDENL